MTSGGSLGIMITSGYSPMKRLLRPLTTLELPWLKNLPNKSCIPEGDYVADRFDSPRWGPTLKLNNVPDRSDIEFHIGNKIEDSEGCILVGSGYSNWTKELCVVDSKMAFAEFQSWLVLKQVKSAKIVIRDAPCTMLPPEFNVSMKP